MKLLRRCVALLVVTAYVGVMMLQASPMAYAAASADMSSGVMHQQDSRSDKMPCEGMVPGCVSDLGCVFLLSLPAAPPLDNFTGAAWSSVIYPGSSRSLHGRTIKPALGPPISFA